MASLKNIKLKIISVKKTATVTHAMEAVSAVKMRKSQERALGGRLYAASALSILERVSGTADFGQFPLMQERKGKTVFVVVTSDKGLAGSLNSAVIRKTESEIERLGLAKDDIVMIGIGRRGADYFSNRGYDMRGRHENVSDAASETDMRVITDSVLAWHAEGEVGCVYIIYTNFLSTFEQEAVSNQIVPISPAVLSQMIKHIRPVKGKYAPPPADGVGEARPASYVIEPDSETIVSFLLPKLVNISVFHGLLESKASEHSARMVAMKNATDNAKDKAKQYTRLFNKVRQAAITREISEITSGIEAMR
jgi:F-type H+-transporting ATPase subunit gamma